MNIRSYSDDDSAPRFEGRVSLGNILTIITGAVMLAAAWGALQTDFRAMAQRVDKNEVRSERTSEAIDNIKSSISEMRAEQKAIRADADRLMKQLDRAVERIDALTRVLSLPVAPLTPNGKQSNPN